MNKVSRIKVIVTTKDGAEHVIEKDVSKSRDVQFSFSESKKFAAGKPRSTEVVEHKPTGESSLELKLDWTDPKELAEYAHWLGECSEVKLL